MTGQAKSTSSQNQDSETGCKTSKIVWKTLYSLVVIGTIVYAIIYKTKVEFHADNDLSTKKVQSNTSTDTCYRRVEKETYPVLANIGLGLLGLILAPIIYRLCNIVEELCQLKSCYNRNICRLFKEWFTGFLWKPVIIVGGIDVLAVGFAKQWSFEWGDFMYISGGIGLSPLVSYLLNLNALTKVDHSRFVEKGGLHPAYTLAWNYYTHYLENVFPIFIKCFSNSNIPVQDQQESNEHLDRDAQPNIPLSSKELILLFSHNYKKEVKLVDLDDHISKLNDVCKGGYKFPIYGLKYNGREYRYVIQFAKEPLETIQRMCDSEECKPVHNDQLEDQVMLLYRTLSDILKNKGFYRNLCTLVLITGVESLENGGLVKVIMSYIREDERASNTESPGTNSAMIQAQETDDTSELSLADVSCSSTTVNINDVEGKVQFNIHDGFIPADDQDEISALVGEGKERDKGPKYGPQLQSKRKSRAKKDTSEPNPCSSTVVNIEDNVQFDRHGEERRLERDKGLLNPELQFRKNRTNKSKPNEQREVTVLNHDDPDKIMEHGKQRTSMSAKEQANENCREINTGPPVSSKSNEQQQPIYDNRIPPTSIKTPMLPSDLSGGPKNQDEDVHCPNKNESEERCTGDNQPICDYQYSEGMGNQATCSKETFLKESKKILGL